MTTTQDPPRAPESHYGVRRCSGPRSNNEDAIEVACAGEPGARSGPAQVAAITIGPFNDGGAGADTSYTSKRSSEEWKHPANPGPSPANVNEQLQSPPKAKMHTVPALRQL
jgi:hypothetical protein